MLSAHLEVLVQQKQLWKPVVLVKILTVVRTVERARQAIYQPMYFESRLQSAMSIQNEIIYHHESVSDEHAYGARATPKRVQPYSVHFLNAAGRFTAKQAAHYDNGIIVILTTLKATRPK